MYHLVLPQVVPAAEGLGAHVALEGFLPRVGVQVRRQGHLDPEALRAQLALVRLLARVNPLVLLQFGQVLEAFGAAAAAVRSLIGVAEHVDFEVPLPGAALATLLARERFLPRVGELVQLQRALPPELLPAHLAAVTPLPRVGEEVLPEGVQQVEALVALLAGVPSLSRSLLGRFSTVVVLAAHMQPQVALSAESQAALAARIRLLRRLFRLWRAAVLQLVSGEVAPLREGSPTILAGEMSAFLLVLLCFVFHRLRERKKNRQLNLTVDLRSLHECVSCSA